MSHLFYLDQPHNYYHPCILVALLVSMPAQRPDAVGLLEREISGPRLSWVFPTFGDANDQIESLAKSAGLGDDPIVGNQFVVQRRKGMWYYSLARDRHEGSDAVHSTVSRFAVLIQSHSFDPVRYEALLIVMLRGFNAEEGSPLALLQRLLSVATKGSASAPGGANFMAATYATPKYELAEPDSIWDETADGIWCHRDGAWGRMDA